jgi:FAD:protein FMN transferase
MHTWASRQWRAMGSPCELLVYGTDVEHLADSAVAEVERLEACWTRFGPESELSELNRAEGRWFPASSTLWEALVKARWAWSATGGLFDPTVLGRLVSLGYDRTFREVPSTGALPTAPVVPLATLGFGQVLFDDAARMVQVPSGMGLDLGGIGKGLCADLVTAGAMAAGAVSICLSLGGDIRVRGPGPDQDDTWRLDVQHPADDRVLGSFPLSEEALVQSTTLFRQWERDGRQLHHLIDPRTGCPSSTDLIGAVVTGVDAWWAEVVAKTAILLGATDGLAFVIQSGLDCWLLRADGTVVPTSAVAGDLESVQR